MVLPIGERWGRSRFVCQVQRAFECLGLRNARSLGMGRSDSYWYADRRGPCDAYLLISMRPRTAGMASPSFSPFFRDGYFSIAEGDMMSFHRRQCWPRHEVGPVSQAQAATVQITFLVADYPGRAPQFSSILVRQTAQTISIRHKRSRLVAVRISSSDLGTFWRIGNIRYRYAPDGKF